VQQYQLDKVAGHGRVWRLVHESTKPVKQPRMYEETSAELVAHLSHPNGWWRDTAQRLLVLKQDNTVVPLLEKMTRTDANPLARIHALWTLQGLDAITPELVREKMADTDPKIRANAIRVSETLFRQGDASFQLDIEKLMNDPDSTVVLQALMTAKYLAWPDHLKKVIEVVGIRSTDKGIKDIGAYLALPPGKSMVEYNDKQRETLKKGAEIYTTLCTACHGPNGMGVEVAGLKGAMIAPPLGGSKTINHNPKGGIYTLLKGMQGEVDGKKYEGLMIPMAENDDEWIAAVLSYVRNNFGNSGTFISPADVAQARKDTADRTTPWTYQELQDRLPKLIPPSRMKASASEKNGDARRAIDGDLEGRYTTGKFMEPGMWFQIELNQETSITGVILDSARSKDDYPRGYELAVSKDGKQWTPVTKKTDNKGGVTEIYFNPTRAKFIRITQLGSAKGNFWSIHELSILEESTK
jgi:mono/diheme cytochrome c family protein